LPAREFPCRDNLSKPHILITNDDGIHAAGLRALVEAMKPIAQITVVAPSHERSASAQSLTCVSDLLRSNAENEYSVEGTPADAVILAFHTLLKEKPDLVLSGINRGGNMGENVYYSGTSGQPMEERLSRARDSVSVSYKSKELDYTPAANFARTLVPLILAEACHRASAKRKCARILERGSAFHPAVLEDHANVLQPGADPRGRRYYWLHERSVLRTSSPTRNSRIRDGRIFHHAPPARSHPRPFSEITCHTGPSARVVPQR